MVLLIGASGGALLGDCCLGVWPLVLAAKIITNTHIKVYYTLSERERRDKFPISMELISVLPLQDIGCL